MTHEDREAVRALVELVKQLNVLLRSVSRALDALLARLERMLEAQL